MKRCPQCEFVYENDQSVCDMDGSELIHEAVSLPLPPLAEITGEPANAPAKSPRRSFVRLAIAGVILATLLLAAYYATAHRLRRRNVNRSIASATAAPQPLPAIDSEPSVASVETPSPETTISTDVTPTSPESKPAINARLSTGPVSAAGSAERGRGPVIIRLTNGATIKADEAWEKREGIWYRQAGVVTFIKRNRARAIERAAPARAATPKADAKKAKSETAEPKKESRVSSILKTTGRILKRPFRF
jgi:hypothetical protein